MEPTLQELEARIEASLIEIGFGLYEIKRRKLYRETHGTWADYCEDRWGWSRSWCDRRIRASEAAQAASEVKQAEDGTHSVRPSLDIETLAGSRRRSDKRPAADSEKSEMPVEQRPPTRPPTAREQVVMVENDLAKAYFVLAALRIDHERTETAIQHMSLEQRTKACQHLESIIEIAQEVLSAIPTGSKLKVV